MTILIFWRRVRVGFRGVLGMCSCSDRYHVSGFKEFGDSAQWPLRLFIALRVWRIWMHFAKYGINANCQGGAKERKQEFAFAAR
jgi:hypothetical protein